jgi:hypothetical protein
MPMAREPDIEDPSPALREAVMLLKQAGLREAAAEFESACFATYTTQEEWLARVGVAIRQLRASSEQALPREVEIPLRRALRIVREVWPNA